jgi:hypothetical protein
MRGQRQSTALTNDNLTKVFFEKIITFELVPENIGPDRENLTSGEIHAIAADCRKSGFNERAVVVKRMEYNHQMENPKNWGVVIDLRTWKSVNTSIFCPLKVQWLNGSTSDEWPDDLILIFPALNSRVITELIEDQVMRNPK